MSTQRSTDAPFGHAAEGSAGSVQPAEEVGESSLPQLAQPEGLGSGSDLASEGNKLLAQMEDRVKEKQTVVQDKTNELLELEERLRKAEQRKAELEAQAQSA